jgi:hypothetical protein
MKIYNVVILLCLCHLLYSTVFAQGKLYEGPDDPASDPAAERFGWHSGNRLNLFFRNTTELGGVQPGIPMSTWPNNYDGQRMHDGIATIVGARVFVKNDSIPVEDPDQYLGSEPLDSVYFAQSSFYHFLDKNPEGTIEWGLYPVYGYFNEMDEYPAMSNLPNSWPTGGWPANGDLKWPDEWNGRFGRGIMKADQESFIVANDAQDQEYLPSNPLNDSLYYYPRRIYGNNGEIIKDVKIGEKKSDVTVQKGMPWGGLGIRIEQRGFQWSNPSAQDAIFFEYTIANISEYDISDVYFAYFLDNGPGGEDGDAAYFEKSLNLCYSWDFDGIGLGAGKEPGVVGFAFLESPGVPFDGKDNDEDGLIDEKRDNQATLKIGPTDGIANLYDFLTFYNLEESDLKEHWDADEDQDWQDGFDANGNGAYTYFDSKSLLWQLEPGERMGDDVGLDGVGIFDLNYNGPDDDGTEGNQRPDYREGYGSEPNFASTDISESDMLGLTSFRYELDYTSERNRLSADEVLFHRLTGGIFDEAVNEAQNIIEQFSSGLFPLFKGRTERISMSEFHSYDPLAGLNSSEHRAPALFRLKNIVQSIYEADYRFAQPPLMPTLTATPLDGKVVLSWDNISDRFTREPYLGNINDFEGYKLYRATDKKMADAEVITDGFGTPFMKKPVFQCDLINDVQGFADFALINGAAFNLGTDSGLKYHFEDNTVQNGRTYYYVLTAYDFGIDSSNIKIPPSENTFILELDEYENIRKISPNVAVVKPHQFAAGYQAPAVDEIANETLGTGWARPEILLPAKVKEGHEYKIKFGVENLVYDSRAPISSLYRNDAIRIYDITDGDTLVYEETRESFTGDNFRRLKIDIFNGNSPNFIMDYNQELITAEFDGLLVHFFVPSETARVDENKTGWITGSAPIGIEFAPEMQPGGEQKDIRLLPLPYEFDIVFTGNDSAYVTTFSWPQIYRVSEGGDAQYKKDQILYDQNFNFYVTNRSLQDSSGNDLIMDMVAIDLNENGEFDILQDDILVGTTFTGRLSKWGGTAFSINFFQNQSEDNLPKPGDVYHVSFIRPFMESDSITFKVSGEQIIADEAKLNEDMENIKVVPNPYVATNTFETNVANYKLSQRRRIMFTHVPAQCTIRIFSISGVLVDIIKVDNAISNRETPWDLNSEANGTVFWDLKSREGLDVAAGYYMYHIKAHKTGKEKMGKFAILK